jgi:hypothetical protein
MRNKRTRRADPFVAQVRNALLPRFPNGKVDVYRYNPACIRVRVVDEKFRRRSRFGRERMVEPILAKLPKEVQSEITVLLLLPPEELGKSMMNLEFEHPAYSRL